MPKARTTPSIPLIDTIHEVPAGYVDQSEENGDCLLLTVMQLGLLETKGNPGYETSCMCDREDCTWIDWSTHTHNSFVYDESSNRLALAFIPSVPGRASLPFSWALIENILMICFLKETSNTLGSGEVSTLQVFM